MAAINPLTREVVFKIVFYGPGLGGKTTSLQHIHDASSPDHRGKMVSLATSVDRTLYFDFLPLRLPTVRGMGVRLQLFTVPGQVHYAATRKLVVTGADGVVFVADSQESRLEANADSVDDLRQNLAEQQRDPAAVPLVFQLNKRDLPGIVPMDELAAALAVGAAPVVGSVATTGQGVFETLELVTRAVIRNFERGLPVNQSADAAMLSEERGIEHALRQVRLEGGGSAAAAEALNGAAASIAVPEAIGAAPPIATAERVPVELPTSDAVQRKADEAQAPVVPHVAAEPSAPAAPSPVRSPLDSPSAGVVASSTGSAVPPARSPSPSVSLHEGSRAEGSSPGVGGDSRSSQVGAPSPARAASASSPSPSPPSRRRPSAPSLGAVQQQETSWPAPVSETPTITPVPAMGFSLAELWPEGERELVREAEAAIAIRDLERAVELLDRVATRALANTVAMLGSTDSPRDPLLALGLLGVDGRRYLAFRALVRDVRAGAKASDRLTLGAYAFLLEVRSARSRIGL